MSDMESESKYYNEEDKKRLSKILMMSRFESGLSQEKVALELGIAKKTVQNWERGISAPTLLQAVEWFRVMKVPAMPYFLQFLFPQLEGTRGDDSDEKIRSELIQMVESLPGNEIRQLMFLFYGDHGSSPAGIMNMVTAHLQTPMKDRYNHAFMILNDYELALEKGQIMRPDHVQPDIALFKKALQFGRNAVLEDKNNYFLVDDK